MSKSELTNKKPGLVWNKIPVIVTPLGRSGGNLTLEKKGLMISYQDFHDGGRAETLEMMAEILTGDDRRDDETALYDGKVWRILWGDHRKAYEKAFPKGLKACIKVYEKLKPKYGSKKWSTDDKA